MDKRASRRGWLLTFLIILGIVWILIITIKDGQRLLNPSERNDEPVPYHSKER